MGRKKSLRSAALVAFLLAGFELWGVGCGPSSLVGVGDGGADAAQATPDAAALDAGAGDAGDVADAGFDAGSDAGSDAGVPPTVPDPIVLAHGFFGFEDFAGAGFLTYFYGVKARLLEDGEAQVFTPSVDPFNSSEVRGAQLLVEVEKILAETGAQRVNLIGHSQGGLDARWVAHFRPDLVASVTTVATPHHGSKLADIILGLISDPRARDLLDALTRLIGAPLWDAMGNNTSVIEALRQFTNDAMLAFNARITDDPAVAYFSIAGRSDYHLAIRQCRVQVAPAFIRRFEREVDPIDPLLDIAEMILDGGLGDPYPNDGLVRVVDARWGTFLGCIPADHMDEVGQIGGDRPGIFNAWRHLDFYSELVAWLRAGGF